MSLLEGFSTSLAGDENKGFFHFLIQWVDHGVTACSGCFSKKQAAGKEAQYIFGGYSMRWTLAIPPRVLENMMFMFMMGYA